MRSDIEHIISERGAIKYWSGEKYHRQRPNAHNMEDLPTRAPMRRTKDRNVFLAPIRRFLIGSIGRRWDNIFSDICHVCSSKTFTRKEVSRFVLGLVDTMPSMLDWQKGALYVDEDGILRMRDGFNTHLGRVRKRVKKEPLEFEGGRVVSFKGVYYFTPEHIEEQFSTRTLDNKGVFILDRLDDRITSKYIKKSKTKRVELSRSFSYNMTIDFYVSWWNELEKRILTSDERRVLNI